MISEASHRFFRVGVQGPLWWYRPFVSENRIFSIEYGQSVGVHSGCRSADWLLASSPPAALAFWAGQEAGANTVLVGTRAALPRVVQCSAAEGVAVVVSFLLSSLLLIALVAGGIAAIVATREKPRGGSADRGDCDETWEQTLAEYKNLRDRGVLSEDEYRRIKTFVDPSARTPVTNADEPSAISAERTTTEDWRN